MTIVRILVAILIIYLLYRVVRWLFLPPPAPADPLPNRQKPAITEDLVEDPFCHAYMPVSQAYRVSIDGKPFYFCSEKCFRGYMQQRDS